MPVRAQTDFVEPVIMGDTVDIAPQKELRGGTIDLKNYRGKKVVVLAFWLNTCDLCMQQIKLLDNYIKKDGRDKKIVFITVLRAGEEEKAFTLDALHEYKLSTPVVLDPTLFVARRFSVTTAPSFVLIDKNGRLASGGIQYADKPIRSITLFKMIDQLASGKKIPDLQFIPYTKDKLMRGMIGAQAPELQIGSIDGRVFSLEDYRNKMNVVLFFWHPYSPECKSLVRVLNSFYTLETREKYNFVILAASSIYGQSQMDEARKLQNEVQPGFSFLDDADSKVGNLYKVTSVPTIFVIGKNGRIVDVATSELTSAGIEKRLAAALDSVR
jgi:peroxiredoxin